MIITGQFYDVENRLHTVTFSDGNGSTTRTIGENGLFFSDDPVRIKDNATDPTTVIRMRSAEVNLLTDDYMGGNLFNPNATRITATITRGNDVIFSGYVEPQTYSQPFTSPLDGFTVNCCDKLATLQYMPYLGATPANYDSVKRTATTTRTFASILMSALPTGAIYYDLSKGTTNDRTANIFADLAVSDMVFLGEDADDVDTYEDAVTNILRYLNLHICQRGTDFYIYDNDQRNGGITQWLNIRTLTTTNAPTQGTHTLTASMHAADDTQITVANAYNQISLKCDLDSDDIIISDPLDSDSLTSRYPNKQLYMTEWVNVVGDNFRSQEIIDWINAVKGQTVNNDNVKINDWWMRVKESKDWSLFIDNQGHTIDSVITYDAQGTPTHQEDVPLYCFRRYHMPIIASFGSSEHRPSPNNNEPIGKVSMSDYLYIAVNGVDDIENMNVHSPLIEYLAPEGAATLSPADSHTTNYLVFTGSLTLQPPTYETLEYDQVVSLDYSPMTPIWPVEGGATADDRKLYTRRFFGQEYANDPSTSSPIEQYNLQPPVSQIQQKYQYNYSRDVHGGDLVSKLPILECELIIGNKRLIETDIDEYGNSTFQWVTVGSEPFITYEGGSYRNTTFSLGVNPKLGDYIIGTEYKLQNTITVAMNLDMEGTAIPIKQSDNLTGAMTFRILGVINTTWNQVTRRHPTWFRHTSYQQNDVQLLDEIENVIIKDFKCQIVSDNAMTQTINKADELIYISDEQHTYMEKNDLDTMAIITQPTGDEAATLGIKAAPYKNAVGNLHTGAPLTTLYNAATHETAKPEQHLVDAIYREQSTPRVTMTATMHDGDITEGDIYTSTPLQKSFAVGGINHNIRMATCEVKLNEIDD